MKRIRSCRIPFLALFFFFGCASTTTIMFKDATTIIAHPGENIVPHESEIAILVIPVVYSLEIDGVQIVDRNGEIHSGLKSSKGRKAGPMYAVEILPGMHRLVVSHEDKTANEGRTTQAARIAQPLETNYMFQGGEVYYLELRVHVDGNTDRLIITPLADEYKEIVREDRKRAEF